MNALRWMAALVALTALACGQDAAPSSAAAPAQDDFVKKWKESYAKAVDWMIQQQDMKDGSFGRIFQGKRFASVALTCLSAYGLARLPEDLKAKYKANLDKALEYILGNQDEKDGGFTEPPGQLRTYVTSVAITVLAAADKDKYKEKIERAAKFLKDTQMKEGFWSGSHGYGEKEYKLDKDGRMQATQSESGNASSTAWSAEGVKAAEGAGVPVDPEYWKGIVEWLKKCQNNGESNVDPEVLKLYESRGFKVGNDGGFYYKPDPESAEKYGGMTKDADGKTVINSYGSMTYEAIKTFVYAGLKADDPLVKAAVGWCRKNYAVDRHPGFPYEQDQPAAKRKDNQGLYYYYLAMAKALHALGERPFVTENGKKHDWPREIAETIMRLQKADGSWVNEQVRWWEGDASLCTPYVLKIYSIFVEGKYFEK